MYKYIILVINLLLRLVCVNMQEWHLPALDKECPYRGKVMKVVNTTMTHITLGLLITPRYALTDTSSELRKFTKKNFIFELGSNELFRFRTRIKIEKEILNALYDPVETDPKSNGLIKSSMNDVGLIRLEHSAPFSAHIDTAGIMTYPLLDNDLADFFFFATYMFGKPFLNELKKIPVKILPHLTCRYRASLVTGTLGYCRQHCVCVEPIGERMYLCESRSGNLYGHGGLYGVDIIRLFVIKEVGPNNYCDTSKTKVNSIAFLPYYLLIGWISATIEEIEEKQYFAIELQSNSFLEP